MADFSVAYKITMKNEGGYVNDKDDRGGETFKGIARKYHPTWSGWELVDSMKSKPQFPSCALSSPVVQLHVDKFYKSNFWDVNLLDEFTSQMVANEMFDTGVNMGVQTAAKFLQITLNKLNKIGSLYPNLVEDGKIGNNTIKSLNACIKYKGDSYIYKILNLLQGERYLDLMDKSETQEKFAYGWLDRVDFIKV